jgi:hypothetical protein
VENSTIAAQPPKLATFNVAGYRIEFQKPSQADWDDHRRKTRSEKHSAGGTIREVCQKSLVSSLEEFRAALQKKPAFAAVAARAIAKLAGQNIDAFESADGESATLELWDGRKWVFNAPSFESWEDCQEQIARGRREREAIFRELAHRCAVDAKGLSAFFEEYPAGHEGLANVLTALAGGGIEEEVKKG